MSRNTFPNNMDCENIKFFLRRAPNDIGLMYGERLRVTPNGRLVLDSDVLTVAFFAPDGSVMGMLPTGAGALSGMRTINAMCEILDIPDRVTNHRVAGVLVLTNPPQDQNEWRWGADNYATIIHTGQPFVIAGSLTVAAWVASNR